MDNAIEKKRMNVLNNPFMLHFLFDPYIADNIGSSAVTALSEFVNSFNESNQEKPIKKLLSTSLDICKKQHDLFNCIKKLLKYSKKLEVDNIKDEVNKFCVAFNSSVKNFKISEQIYKNDIEKYIKNIINYTNQNDIRKRLYQNNNNNEYTINNNECKYGLSHDKLSTYSNEEHLYKCILIPRIIENFIDTNIFGINNELFIPSGYYNITKQSGHLIGLYYKKLADKNYRVVLTNSGEGLDFIKYHPKQFNSNKTACIIYKNVDIYILKNALCYEFLAYGLYENDYNIKKYYTNIVSLLFGNSATFIYRYPQYSGSCSFYGIYYFVDYFLNEQNKKNNEQNKKNNIFDNWKTRTEKTLISNVINEILSGNNKSNNIKNFIDILLFNNSKCITKEQYEALNITYKEIVMQSSKIIGEHYPIVLVGNRSSRVNTNNIVNNIYSKFEKYDNIQNKNIYNTLESLLDIFNWYHDNLCRYKATDLDNLCILRKIFDIIMSIANNNDDNFYIKQNELNPIVNLHQIYKKPIDVMHNNINNRPFISYLNILFLHIFLKINETHFIIKVPKTVISEKELTHASKFINNITCLPDNILYIFPYSNFDNANLIYLVAKYINYFPINEQNDNIELKINVQLTDKTIDLWSEQSVTEMKFNQNSKLKIVDKDHAMITESHWNKLSPNQKKFINITTNEYLSQSFSFFLGKPNFCGFIINDDNAISCLELSKLHKLIPMDIIFPLSKNIPLHLQSNNLDYICNLIQNNKISTLNDFLGGKFYDISKYNITKINKILTKKKLTETFKLYENKDINIVNELFDLNSKLFNDQINIINNAMVNCKIAFDTFIALLHILLVYCPLIIKNSNDIFKKILTQYVNSIISQEHTIILKIFYTMCYDDVKYMNDICEFDIKNVPALNYFYMLLSDYTINRNPHIFKGVLNKVYISEYSEMYKAINNATDYFKNNNIIIKTSNINDALKEIQLIVNINNVNVNEYWNIIKLTSKFKWIYIQYFVENYMFYYKSDDNGANNNILYYGIPISKIAHNNIVIKNDTYIYNNNYVNIPYSNKGIPEQDVAGTLLNNIIILLSNICHTTPLLWKDQIIDEYIIEFPSIFQYDTTKYLKFIYKDKKLYYDNYEIIINNYNPLFNNWIYGLDNTIIMENINNQYDKKILLCNWNYFSTFTNSDECVGIWENEIDFAQIAKQIRDIGNNSYDKEKYFHIIDIHYTGLILNFDNDDAIFQYFLGCVYKNKSDCLNSIFNNFMNRVKLLGIENNSYGISENTSNYTAKHPITTKIISEICKKCLYNVPCKYYFGVKINNEHEYKYKMRYLNKKYPEQYSITTKLKEYNNFKYDFKYTSIKTAIDEIIKHNSFPTKNNSFPTIGEKSNIILNKTINIDFDTHKQLSAYLNSRRICEPSLIENININYESIFEQLNIEFELYLDNLYKLFIQRGFSRFKNIEKLYKNRVLLFGMLECKIIMEIFIEIKKMKDKHCYELLKLQDMLDTNIIYDGNRDISTVIFEILFGSFVRNDQYRLYEKIKNEDIVYDVHHMLMGKGKSSVISPLLTIRTILFKQDIQNVIIAMPTHLTTQTYDNFTKQFSYIMDDIIIKNIRVDRDESIKFTNKNIIIIDDTSLKSIKLNSIIKDINEDTILNKSFIIMDEFDSMINPMSCELNFPNGYPTPPENSFFIFNFIVKIIKHILKENNYKEINFNNYNDSKQFIDGFFKRVSYGEIINDTSINISQYINQYNYFVEYCVKNNKNYVGKNTDEQFFIIIGILRKIYNSLILSLTYIYRKDYGFGNDDLSQKNISVAIPFSAVDSPINGSEFTNPEITIILTTFSYFYRKFIKNDLQNIINYANQKKEENPFTMEIILNKYVEIIKLPNMPFDYILECNNDTIINNLLEIFGVNTDLIEIYITDIILPKYINIYETQYNCSFIDIMTSSFTKYKTAFSGTVNIFMPKLNNTEYEFKENIIPDDIANGDIICAILGKITENKCKYVNNDINDIVKYIVDGKYQCLIDTGAFMKNYSVEVVIKEIAKKMDTDKLKKYYIFISDNHKKMVYHDNIYTHLGTNIYESEQIFIYYDHKHTIGIDINQPYTMKGLATFDYFNRFTDMAQGIYRLRKLNYGHTIDFIVSKQYEKINNPFLLYKQLIENENIYKQKSKMRFLLQNIKYLRRQQMPNNKSYIDNIYNEKVTKQQNLEENLFNNYIKNNYCNVVFNNTLIQELCLQVTNENIELIYTGTHKAQQTNINNTKTVSSYVAIEKAKYDFHARIFSWKNNNNKYTINNYINVQIIKDDNTNTQFLYNKHIYLSPFTYDYCSNRDQNNIKTALYLQLHPSSKEKYFVFYYIKKKINNKYNYLILFPNELHMLYMYIEKNKFDNIILKNNFGKIIYGDVDDKMTEHEYLIQILFGNEITISNHIKIFNYFLPNELEGLEPMLSFFSHLPAPLYEYTHFMIFYLENKNNYEKIIIDKYNTHQYDYLLQICGINPLNLSDTQKNQVICSNNNFKIIMDKHINNNSIIPILNDKKINNNNIIPLLNDKNINNINSIPLNDKDINNINISPLLNEIHMLVTRKNNIAQLLQLINLK